LLAALAERGLATVPEVARRILLALEGMELRARDPLGFAQAMLEEQLKAWEVAPSLGPIVFDRGFPDIVGFLRVEGLPVSAAIDRACRSLRFDGPVFRAKAWQSIYRPDEQRRQTWSEAVASDEAVTSAWREYGYEPIDLPQTSVSGRARFVIARL
tara:strand:+ start:5640 stop:6107 length:468 start_codon:yes stop_codon:yes gene_type:complete